MIVFHKFGAGKSILFNKINVKNKIKTITINLINNLIVWLNLPILVFLRNCIYCLLISN